MQSLIPILKRVCTENSADFYLRIDKALERQEKKFIITANPEIIMMGSKNNKMHKILMDDEVEIIPDGIGLVKSLKLLYPGMCIQRNTGIELVEHLLSAANVKKKTIFIFGAREDVLIDFLKMCSAQYPHIIFSGCYNGYDYTEDDILNIIQKCDADIYFAALGTPKQELFLNRIYQIKQHGIFVGIGGSLDVLSGKIKRAPAFFLNHNLEWLYRITTEPKRIKRFLKSNILYVFLFFINYVGWKVSNIILKKQR